jgi:hypothetical protein
MGQNQQPQGGNSMAAILGNLRGQPGQQNLANYGAGMQPSTMGGAIGPYQPPPPNQLPGVNVQAPTQGWGGGQGGGLGAQNPQEAVQNAIPPDQKQNMLAQRPQVQQIGGLQQPGPRASFGGSQGATGFRPMPSTGAPGGGAAGKAPGVKQGIGQLPGGPSTGAPGGGAGGGKGQVKQGIGQLPGGPPMQQRVGAMLGNRLPRPPGMQPNPATAYGR